MDNEDASVAEDLRKVGAYHFKRGVTQFADWSKIMIDDFGEGVRPYLDKTWGEMAAMRGRTEIENPRRMAKRNLGQRVLLWIAASAILAVLAFPEVDTMYTYWDNGTPLKLGVIHNGHRIVSSVEIGPKRIDSIFDTGLLALVGREDRNEFYKNCQREAIINWWPSVGYALLIVLIAALGMWALKAWPD